MKTALFLCLSLVVLAVASAEKPECQMSVTSSCASMNCASTFGSSDCYCCEDPDLRAVLKLKPGQDIFSSTVESCSCYTSAEYCAENKWACW